MTYTKPEVNTLGNALRVIEFVQKPNGGSPDSQTPFTPIDPAYDLDE